jgi:ribosome-binding protein aMBF1 (putative translation factor)
MRSRVDLTMGYSKHSKPDYNERFTLSGSSFESVVRRAINQPNGNGHMDDGRLQQIAAIVRERRAALGWSRRRLSQIADVDQSTIKHLEDGDRIPRAETVHKMEQALEVTFPA